MMQPDCAPLSRSRRVSLRVSIPPIATTLQRSRKLCKDSVARQLECSTGRSRITRPAAYTAPDSRSSGVVPVLPIIGNTGTTPEDLESGAVYAAGLVIRDLPVLHSNWRATESLQSFLLRCKVVAIGGIDTRKLTRLLRDKGAQSGCIMTGEKIDQNAAVRA